MSHVSHHVQFDGSARGRIAHVLSLVEDAVYIGLGFLLAVAALSLLVIGFRTFLSAVYHHTMAAQFVDLLDQILLVLLVIELLYTVQVSFREHGLVAEPFIVVALIAVIRRVLVLTAEFPKLPHADDGTFRHAWIELALLAVMTVILVGSLIQLQKHIKPDAPNSLAEREPSGV
jgi:uncharacterized membrane protein (DUF373 family)